MSLDTWFHSEFTARALAATVWTILLEIPIISILSIIFSGSPTFWNGLLQLFQYRHCFSYLFVVFAISVLTGLHCKFFRVESRLRHSRWEILRDALNPYVALFVLSRTLVGGLCVNSFFSLAVTSLGKISVQCIHRNGLCLNEAYIFGTLFGCFLGFIESIDYLKNEKMLLKFPLLTQHFRVIIQSNVVTLLKKSVTFVTKCYLGYLCLYFLFGSVINSKLSRIASLDEDDPSSIVALISLTLAFRCIIVGTAWLFSIKLSALLFELYQTKYVMFPIARAPGEMGILLHDAINSDIPLLRLWACRDWSILTEQSAFRRSQIFSVSQPGNHPHNWNNVVGAILPICSQFLVALNGKSVSVKNQEVMTSTPISVTSPTRLRNLAMTSPIKSVEPTEQPKPSLIDKLYNKLEDVYGHIKKLPIVCFIWGELPDSKRREVFAKAQPVVFLIEGLSHIISASYLEDKYGVLQKDLPAILSLLLNMQSAIELRGTTTGVLQKRPESLVKTPTDIMIKHRLKWAVKSALYRIVIRFQHHILDVSLSSEHKQMLEHYLEFRVS